jgi:amino acid transporter
VLVYSRVPFVMGRDGYLPKALMRTNRWDAPWVSLIVSGVLYTIVILMFRNVEELASADVTVYGAMMSLELLSFLVLRWREPNLPRPFRVPGGWGVATVHGRVLPSATAGSGRWWLLESRRSRARHHGQRAAAISRRGMVAEEALAIRHRSLSGS